MADPIVVTAVFRPRPSSHDQVVTALRASIPAVHEEPGCLLYAIHDAPDGSIVMIEKWSSTELLDAHGSGAPVAALGASVEGLLAEPVEVTRLVPITAGTAQQGTL